ncbi:MAG: acetate/propionate family kinase [Steroidobacteraceae bacterium]
MLILTVNGGSTSVKLAAFARTSGSRALVRVVPDERSELRSGSAALADHVALLRAFLRKLGSSQVAAVGHRVVHGGARMVSPRRIDAGTEAALRELSDLAPLHNPLALEWLAAARAALGPETPQVAVFDTAFFASLPRTASEYALPRALGEDLGVRRYGFHGIAHQAMWRRWRELHSQLEEGGRLITLQLGGGCSMAAIDRGRPIDTSMGFSPLEGLVMATRSGDVDPAAVAYLARKLGASPDTIVERLNHECGLLGISGSTGDLKRLVDDSRPAAQFAVELYCYRARKLVGAYLAALEGCDGIVFGGGVGEHMPQIRERILAPLAWAGIELDPRANEAARGGEACISRPASPIGIRVLPPDEERTLAEAALAYAEAHGSAG